MRVSLPLVLSCLFACRLFFFPSAAVYAACASNERKLYLPFSPGSQVEQLIVPFLEPWRQSTLQKINPEYFPGKGGSYAWSRLARDPENGCSFALVQTPSLLFLADLADGMLSKDELAPVAMFAAAPNALWVSENSPFQSLDDLLSHVKNNNSTPGSYIFIAGMGNFAAVLP